MSRISLPAVYDGGVSRYLSEIDRFPLLDPHEEIELSRRLRDEGDREAAYRLVTSHLRLAAKLALQAARKYSLQASDAIQEANVGLMKAVKKYDPDRGTRLATVAMWWIKHQLTEFILYSWSLLKIGGDSARRKLFFALGRHRASIERYEGALTEAEATEIAAATGTKPDQVREIDTLMHAGQMLSLDAPNEGSGAALDIADDLPNPEEATATEELRSRTRKLVHEALASLDIREREIIVSRKMSETPVSLEELGRRLGVSRERARQLEARAVKKLESALAPAIADVLC